MIDKRPLLPELLTSTYFLDFSHKEAIDPWLSRRWPLLGHIENDYFRNKDNQ